jgi:hypothetical protein
MRQCLTETDNIAPKDNKILTAIEQPVLVVSGSNNDTVLPDSDAYFRFKHLKKAQLLLPRRRRSA